MALKRLVIVVPASGSEEEMAVEMHSTHSSSTQVTLTHSTRDFAGVVYLLTWVADAADWCAEDDPRNRPTVEVTSPGMTETVAWFDRIFERNGGPFLGCRELLETTGLIEEPKLLTWLL